MAILIIVVVGLRILFYNSTILIIFLLKGARMTKLPLYRTIRVPISVYETACPASLLGNVSSLNAILVSSLPP